MEEISALAAKDVFNGVPSAYVDVQSEPVSGYGEAFRLARNSGRDYFVIFTASETERTYSLDAVIYSARTGTKTSEVHVYRTGNDCMARALQRFRQGVLDILPIRGKVLRNVHGQLLVDLGKMTEFQRIQSSMLSARDVLLQKIQDLEFHITKKIFLEHSRLKIRMRKFQKVFIRKTDFMIR